MAITLAIDIYGTLFNTSGIKDKLISFADDKADKFDRTWREKQIEYSFRRGLMRQYKPFNVCIEDALDYACVAHQIELSDAYRQTLLDVYRQLPLFPDVIPALGELRSDSSFELCVLSNATPDDLDALLSHAGIKSFFKAVVSVDEIQSFKPNPEVYKHFIDRVGTSVENTWMVSGNTFDFVGAMSFGYNGAFVKRSTDIIVDPWEIEPSIVIDSLADLRQEILDFISNGERESAE